MTDAVLTGLIRDQVAAVASGKLTVVALVDHALEAIRKHDPDITAWAHLDPAAVREAATVADAGDGALRGLLFAAKDNIDTHDMPTAYGSPVHEGAQPARDAAVVALLRLEGALLLGKTVSTEFAHRFPGPTRNPWNKSHTPGGSSSGSAAAVASGMIPLAFGSQTTGSVIRPAAYCGVVGYKPTYGDLNPSGMLANTPSFDTVGMMARHVDDIAFVRAHLLDDQVAPLTPPAVNQLRIGVCRTPYWDAADADAQASLEATSDRLAKAGATIVDFDDGGAFTGIDEDNITVSGFEFARTMAHERLYAIDQLSPDLRDGRMQDGLDTNFEQYRAAQIRLERARLQLDDALEDIDSIITLPAPGAAPEGLRFTGPATFNMLWTTLHTPAITLPLFESANGLPMGLQLCAKRRSDRHLLAQALTMTQLLTT
jgi:Asp-tRNA(Asn)/Glu-tRNA(Gln) amidotransferase A subunit family amidase